MQQHAQSNSPFEVLLHRDSGIAPPAEYVPSVGPERSYFEIRNEYRREMVALYPNRDIYRYHNFDDHIESGSVYLELLLRRCKQEGVAIDVDAVDAAWIGHDAGYASDPTILGFKSREHMHATLAYRSLRAKGVPEEFARRVERAIAVTNPAETPITNEDKAIRATDMHNLAQTYPQMRDNSLRLYEEMRNTGSTTLSLPDFVRISVNYLGLYMLPYLQLTTAAADQSGRSAWHIKAFENVLRLWREHCKVPPQILAVMSDSSTPPELVERRGLGGHEGVIFAAVEGRAKEFHSSGTRLLRRWGSAAALACTPMVGTAISLASQSVDEVLLNASECERYLEEAVRILRPEGTLTLISDFNQVSLQRASEVTPMLTQSGFELVSEESDVHGSISRFRQMPNQ